jgi:cathepsin B
MFKLVFVGTVIGFAAASTYHPVNPQVIAEIKEKANWKPIEMENNKFAKMTYQQIKNMLGAIPSTENDTTEYLSPTIVSALPDSYDSRVTGCVHDIRDQQQCGSCWAFAGSEVLSDRFCLAGVDVILSPEDLVSCDRTNFGCNGGNLATEWKYMTNKGIVTDTCFPYTAGAGVEAACVSSCISNEDYVKYTCEAGSVVKSTTVQGIKSDIYANGPVETGFTVYADFMSYSSGIYHHVSGAAEGGHAVKIVGWGSESGEDYWLVANSWNTDWGLEGFFKIRQGDSGIDDATYACTPDVASARLFVQ